MNLGTAVVLAIVVAVVAFALRATFKKKGSCGCDCGCEGCSSAEGCNVQAMIDNLEVGLASK